MLIDQISKVKKYIRPTLYVIGGLILLYGLIYLFTKKDQMSPEMKAAIDSLTKANVQLVEKQKQLDSTISVYKLQVDAVDGKIDNIKEKTIIIREYYHEQIQAVDKYTPTEVEGFFKHRYNY